MTVRLLRPFNGFQLNEIVELDRATEDALVNQLQATRNLQIGTPFTPNQVYEYEPADRGFQQIESGVWYGLPAMFRLRLMGSGTITMDARNRLGVETLAVQTFSAVNAADQIEFPYLGDDTVQFRSSFPTTLAVEVLK